MDPRSPLVLFVLVVMLGLISLRLYFKLRAARALRPESWDARTIEKLRSQGYAPFNEYRVDFFLALPNEAACAAVRARLEPEFSVDMHPLKDDPENGLSLHASKMMRLLVPDVQEISRRLSALASEYQGRYDGWAA